MELCNGKVAGGGGFRVEKFVFLEIYDEDVCPLHDKRDFARRVADKSLARLMFGKVERQIMLLGGRQSCAGDDTVFPSAAVPG